QVKVEWAGMRDTLATTCRRYLCRGEASIASLGMAVIVILIATLAACAYFLTESGTPAAISAIPDVGLVGAASLLMLLLVYRHFRSRMAAVGAIREALLDMQRGESSESALLIAGNLGGEAQAWNQIMV